MRQNVLILPTWPMFVNQCIHQEAEPESLQNMENKTFFSIQETQTEEVAIHSIKKRSNEEWTVAVTIAQPAAALDRRSHKIRFDLPPLALGGAHLTGFHLG